MNAQSSPQPLAQGHSHLYSCEHPSWDFLPLSEFFYNFPSHLKLYLLRKPSLIASGGRTCSRLP